MSCSVVVSPSSSPGPGWCTHPPLPPSPPPPTLPLTRSAGSIMSFWLSLSSYCSGPFQLFLSHLRLSSSCAQVHAHEQTSLLAMPGVPCPPRGTSRRAEMQTEARKRPPDTKQGAARCPHRAGALGGEHSSGTRAEAPASSGGSTRGERARQCWVACNDTHLEVEVAEGGGRVGPGPVVARAVRVAAAQRVRACTPTPTRSHTQQATTASSTSA